MNWSDYKVYTEQVISSAAALRPITDLKPIGRHFVCRMSSSGITQHQQASLHQKVHRVAQYQVLGASRVVHRAQF